MNSIHASILLIYRYYKQNYRGFHHGCTIQKGLSEELKDHIFICHFACYKISDSLLYPKLRADIFNCSLSWLPLCPMAIVSPFLKTDFYIPRKKKKLHFF